MRWQIGLAIVATVAACGKKADDGAEPSPLVPVGIGTVAQDTISQVITLTGRLVPLPGGSALLSAPADAMVRTVAVQIGERVRQGELLIELDAPDLAANAKAWSPLQQTPNMKPPGKKISSPRESPLASRWMRLRPRQPTPVPRLKRRSGCWIRLR
jgi:hypothetical protein